MGLTASMNIFLKQEIDRMQVVIILVRKTLKDLLLAIEGIIIMSEVYLKLFKTFFFNFFLFAMHDSWFLAIERCSGQYL